MCPAVERVPERVSGAWVFKGTRVPVRALFENLEEGATTDQNLQNQQNHSGRRIAVIVLPTTRWLQIQRHAVDVVAAVAAIQSGEYRTLSW